MCEKCEKQHTKPLAVKRKSELGICVCVCVCVCGWVGGGGAWQNEVAKALLRDDAIT